MSSPLGDSWAPLFFQCKFSSEDKRFPTETHEGGHQGTLRKPGRPTSHLLLRLMKQHSPFLGLWGPSPLCPLSLRLLCYYELHTKALLQGSV